MREWKKQSHVTWYCLYHIVFIPKYRKKAIFGILRKEIGGIFRELCNQFGIGLIDGHAQPDHIHMCLSIPPRYAVAQIRSLLQQVASGDISAGAAEEMLRLLDNAVHLVSTAKKAGMQVESAPPPAVTGNAYLTVLQQRAWETRQVLVE